MPHRPPTGRERAEQNPCGAGYYNGFHDRFREPPADTEGVPLELATVFDADLYRECWDAGYEDYRHDGFYGESMPAGHRPL